MQIDENAVKMYNNGVDERLSQLVQSIGTWADHTFANAGKDYRGPGIVAHLRREVEELAADPTDMSEIADCIILLFHLAKQNQDRGARPLFHHIVSKHEVNKKRKWQKPDAEGVVEHIREETDNGS